MVDSIKRIFTYLFRPFSNFTDLLRKHELHKALRFHAALASVVYVFALLLLYAIDSFSENFSIISILFLSGALGGVTNNYWRLRNVPSNVNGFVDDKNNLIAIIQIYVSPVLAGAFGIVLYSIFASGILQGSLFPEFKAIDGDYNTMKELLRSVAPSKQDDAIKAIVWSFVAGFSEAMVPNIIDKLAKEPVAASKTPAKKKP